jgi:Astacin (Peptidase family M12A)
MKSQGVGVAPWRSWPNYTKWPFNEIPFIISDSPTVPSPSVRQKILDTIAWWNLRVGVKYVPYNNQGRGVVFNVGSGCSYASAVGRNLDNFQNIYLGLNCISQGQILHEMAHTAGLFHEQQRCDRDNYVYVTYAWWDFGSATNNGKQCASDIVDYGMYDYSSDMHYPYGSYGGQSS